MGKHRKNEYFTEYDKKHYIQRSLFESNVQTQGFTTTSELLKAEKQLNLKIED